MEKRPEDAPADSEIRGRPVVQALRLRTRRRHRDDRCLGQLSLPVGIQPRDERRQHHLLLRRECFYAEPPRHHRTLPQQPRGLPAKLGCQRRQLLRVLRRPPPPLLRADRCELPHGHHEISGRHSPRRPPLGKDRHRGERSRYPHARRDARGRLRRTNQRCRPRHHDPRDRLPVSGAAPRETHRRIRQPVPQCLPEIQPPAQPRRPPRLQLHHPPPLLREPLGRLDHRRRPAHRDRAQSPPEARDLRQLRRPSGLLFRARRPARGDLHRAQCEGYFLHRPADRAGVWLHRQRRAANLRIHHYQQRPRPYQDPQHGARI